MTAGFDRSLRLLRAAILASAVVVVVAILVGFLGRFAMPLDSVSHFRLHLGVAAIVLAVVFAFERRLRGASVLGAAAGLALFSALPYVLPAVDRNGDPGGASYTLLQMNLRYDAPDRVRALQAIAETRPDIVTLQEMTPDWRQTLRPLDAAYPHQVFCDGADGRQADSAILSRRPFVLGTTPVCDRRNSLAAVAVDFNGGPVTIVSHHQLWPWPAGQWARLDRLRPTLETLDGEIVLAGDFNAAPWSAFVRSYERILGTQAVRGIGGSWILEPIPFGLARIVGLPIDNVLVTPGIVVEAVRSLAPTTSDHLPVLVRFSIARETETPPALPQTSIVAISPPSRA